MSRSRQVDPPVSGAHRFCGGDGNQYDAGVRCDIRVTREGIRLSRARCRGPLAPRLVADQPACDMYRSTVFLELNHDRTLQRVRPAARVGRVAAAVRLGWSRQVSSQDMEPERRARADRSCIWRHPWLDSSVSLLVCSSASVVPRCCVAVVSNAMMKPIGAASCSQSRRRLSRAVRQSRRRQETFAWHSYA
jgi:hypothetical protein